jgi:hypothetical protein
MVVKRGMHKILIHKLKVEAAFDKWKKAGTSVKPRMNEKEFYESVLDYLSEDDKKKFEDGKMTEEEFFDKLDRCAEGVMSDDEGEPNARVFYSDDEDEPHTIGHYHDDTDGDFSISWVSSGGWRGYHTVKSKRWTNVHTDDILSMSEDAGDLEQFDKEFQETLKGKGIRFARVFTTTSNVFSTGYDFFVPNNDAPKVMGIAKSLAKKHRDPEKFEFTALTGTDPSKATPKDKLFVKAVGELKKGATPEEAVKKVLKEKKEE